MSIAHTWLEELDGEVLVWVLDMVSHQNPSEAQIAEVIDMAQGYTIDAMGLEAGERERLESAIDELERRLNEADPRHKFLKMHEDIAPGERLLSFYDDKTHADYQHHYLDDTNYATYRLYVDFDAIANLMNPDFTEESIGAQYVEFADLRESPAQDPGECYAHLAIDPQTTMIYLMEPSGQPELIADDLDGFLARLKSD